MELLGMATVVARLFPCKKKCRRKPFENDCVYICLYEYYTGVTTLSYIILHTLRTPCEQHTCAFTASGCCSNSSYSVKDRFGSFWEASKMWSPRCGLEDSETSPRCGLELWSRFAVSQNCLTL